MVLIANYDGFPSYPICPLACAMITEFSREVIN